MVDEAIAKELRPNPEELAEIQEILAKPDFFTLQDSERSTLWRYRYFLQSKKDALIKVLLSAKWEQEKEEKEAITLLNSWAEIDLEQAIMMDPLFPLNTIYGKKYFPCWKHIREKGVAFLDKLKEEDLDSVYFN